MFDLTLILDLKNNIIETSVIGFPSILYESYESMRIERSMYMYLFFFFISRNVPKVWCTRIRSRISTRNFFLTEVSRNSMKTCILS